MRRKKAVEPPALSCKVIDFSKAAMLRKPDTQTGVTRAELERALAIVHVAIEEYRKDWQSARFQDGEVAALLDGFGLYLAGRGS